MRPRLELILSFVLVGLIIASPFLYHLFHSQAVLTKDLQTNVSYRMTEVGIGGTVLEAKIADTDTLRTEGLSGTSKLLPGNAMLFVFDTPGRYSFWMKDMNYAIDMIWLDGAKHVVSIRDHATPESYPETFAPNSDTVYVIEVPDGFAKEHSIQTGDDVQFSL